AGTSSSPPSAPPTAPSSAPCSVNHTGAQGTFHLQAASPADSLALDVRTDHSLQGDATSGAPLAMAMTHLVISRQGAGAQPVVRVDATHTGSASHITYQYGAGIQGMRQVMLTTSDGQTYEGTIDGTPLQP